MSFEEKDSALLTWDAGKNEPLVEASIISNVNHAGQKIIIYQGKDAYALIYSGRIDLLLQMEEQTTQGTYEYRKEMIPFTLVGRFTDPEMRNFTGTWTETDYTSDFSF